MITVAIVDDDPDIRSGLELIIDGTPGFSCTGVYEDGESAIEQIPHDPPDIVLMDIGLPGISGIDSVRIIKEQVPDIEFIMLTALENNDYIFDSLSAGACGYLLKDTPPLKLLDAIKDTYEGGAAMSNAIARRLVNSFRKAPPQAKMTNREQQVLLLLCDGLSYQETAKRLFISEDTVRSHIRKIYKKLEVHSKSQAVAKALRNRLISHK